MAIKTIVACLTTPKTAANVAEAALHLAERHEAHLVGLHVIPQVPIYGLAGIEFPGEIIDREEQVQKDQAGEIEKLFAEATKSSSTGSEWLCMKSSHVDLAAALLQTIPCADLIVMSQFPGMEGDSEVTAGVLVGTGRPVLVIPTAGDWKQIGTRAVIAWNGTREAVRAAFDAAPLLQHAKSVSILAINPKGNGAEETRTSGEDLAQALSRHGIKATTTTSRPADISAGDELLSRLADDSCDLLVMGCYGHSRLRELVFGGVTKHILEHMTAPVLMTH